MPPRIYNGSLRAINFPKGASFDFGDTSWVNINFSPFNAQFSAGSPSLNVVFSSFNVSFRAENKSSKLNTTFQSFIPSFNVLVGATSTFNIEFPKFNIKLNSTSFTLSKEVLGVSASISCFQVPQINLSTHIPEVKLSSEISNTITITSTDNETSDGVDALKFTGNKYIVVNLKTKAHSLYMDGNNNATAKTGELSFGGPEQKNVSDLYVLSRSTGPINVIVNNGEAIERSYEVTYGINGDASLKEKKIQLGKGLRGSTWQISIDSATGEHLDVRTIELIINKLRRRF